MDLLYLLEKIRIPVLNEFMLLITQLGDETAFLVLALVVFWCVDKYKGYFILAVGFVGTIVTQFMKLWFRIPRPWVRDENFTYLEPALEGAGGYSFPSGHSQIAVGTYGALACTTKKRWLRIAAVIIAVLVPFSRMYVGVHTPLDVIVGSAVSLGLIFLIRPMVFGREGKNLPILLVVMALLAVGYLCFTRFYSFPKNIDAVNLAEGTENAYSLLGALMGFLIVYIVDQKWLNFSTKAVWWAQILKLIGGLAIVLVVMSTLEAPLNSYLGAYAGRLVRYFLVVIVAGILWPMTFKWFSKLGSKE